MTLPGGTDFRRRQKAIETGPASQIENDVAGLQTGGGNRVAAAEAEVRACRDSSLFVRRVAQGGRIIIRRHRATAARPGFRGSRRAAGAFFLPFFVVLAGKRAVAFAHGGTDDVGLVDSVSSHRNGWLCSWLV